MKIKSIIPLVLMMQAAYGYGQIDPLKIDSIVHESVDRSSLEASIKVTDYGEITGHPSNRFNPDYFGDPTNRREALIIETSKNKK